MNSPLFYFFLGIVFVWVVSYFYNFQISRSKLKKVGQWLNEGLFILGGKPSSRWRGANTLQILLNGGRGAISDGAIVLGTQSKELFAALVSLTRGGRDSMNFLFTLQPVPPLTNNFEIFEANGQIPRVVILNAGGEWQTEITADEKYKIAYHTVSARDTAQQLLSLLRDYGMDVRRISLRNQTPHLLLSFNLRGQINVASQEFLQTIRNLAEESVRDGKPSEVPPSSKPRNGKSSKPKSRPLSPEESGGSLTPRFGPPMRYKPGTTKNHNGHSNGNGKNSSDPPSLN